MPSGSDTGASRSATVFPAWTPRRLALALGVAAGLAVLATLGDPGLTVDEPLDVRPGRAYVGALRAEGWRFFSPAVVDRVFRDNAEHPPLGRWLLGIASVLGEPFEVMWLGPDPVRLYVLSARMAPALAFAALVSVVTAAAARRYGRAAGAVAGLSLLLMPRVFAHAHLGALDTFLTLFWTLALLHAEHALRSPRPVRAMVPAGAALALALLTKIHAWFLLPIVGAWAVLRIRTARGLVAWLAWASTGLGLYILGWPWLWYDPAGRLQRYLGTGIHRAAIRVLYFGQVYADRDVPWHYPWFYFAVTVPVGLHLLGAWGAVRGWRQRRSDPFPLLLLGSIACFLLVFSTSVAVYDGERLILVVFPLWGILIGLGFAEAWRSLGGRRLARAGLVGLVVAQGYGAVALHPFGLSYYNVLVGGLPGAERLGLELTYWGDAVDRVLLDRLVATAPQDAPAALVPTLYPGQGAVSTTRPMIRRGIVMGDEEDAPRAGWVVVSRRTAYWRPGLRRRLEQGEPVITRTRQGVWLSGVWRFPP